MTAPGGQAHPAAVARALAAEADKPPRPLLLLLGLLVAIALWAVGHQLPFARAEHREPGCRALAVTAFVCFCWLTDAMPLAASSLIPLAFFPLLGVAPTRDIAPGYSDPVLYLFFGGFALAIGMQRWGLHRRLALRVILWIGTSPRRLVLGFMCASAFISTFTNNTATTLMLFPIAAAAVENLESARGFGDQRDRDHFALNVMLGIAFGCSIGGTATPIGTAPNALFFLQFAPYVEHGAPNPTFVHWTLCFLPLTLVFVPLMWLLFVRVLAPVGRGDAAAGARLREQALALPPMNPGEKRMLLLFLIAVGLWMTREDLDLGEWGRVPGWWNLLRPLGIDNAGYMAEGSVGVLVAILAFLIPVDRRRGEFLLDWQSAKTMPWDVLLLLGGGMAIARAFDQSGLSKALANLLQPVIGSSSPFVLVVAVCALMVLLTEFTSNTAITSLMLPVLKSAALTAQVDPRLLMLPATVAASLGFMMPAGTPPNAIVFATGLVPLRKMMWLGLWMDLLGIVLLALTVWFLVIPIMGVSITGCPAWAQGR